MAFGDSFPKLKREKEIIPLLQISHKQTIVVVDTHSDEYHRTLRMNISFQDVLEKSASGIVFQREA